MANEGEISWACDNNVSHFAEALTEDTALPLIEPPLDVVDSSITLSISNGIEQLVGQVNGAARAAHTFNPTLAWTVAPETVSMVKVLPQYGLELLRRPMNSKGRAMAMSPSVSTTVPQAPSPPSQ